ncbi:MAG: hypothetical protein KDC38_08345, partial [Planctomycetes bacterium]|nr:hypothetical protein [Planctomycetota bacterium]
MNRWRSLVAALVVMSSATIASAQYAPTLTTSITGTAPGMDVGLSFERVDVAGAPITTSHTQLFGDGAWDFSGVAPGAAIGFASVSSFVEDDLIATLVVDTVAAGLATVNLIADDLSIELLQSITLSGGSDPTGTIVGTLTLTDGVAGPEMQLDAPQLFPAGTAPFFAFSWLFYLEISTPILTLPAAPTTLTIASTLISDQGDTALASESIDIGASSPDYFPTVTWSPTTLPVGDFSFITQVVTDPMMSRVTTEAASNFEFGAFDLASFLPGSNCGSGDVDFLYPDTYTFDLVVDTVSPDFLSASAIVTGVHPDWLTLLISLGEPDPTGTSILTVAYANNPGDGCSIGFNDHNLFPYGVPPMIGSDLVLTLDHQIGFLAPATPGPLEVVSSLVSSLADTAFLSSTLTVGDVVGGFDRGDCNVDGSFDISDAVSLLGVLFVPGSPPPACDDACDTNDDGAQDIS